MPSESYGFGVVVIPGVGSVVGPISHPGLGLPQLPFLQLLRVDEAAIGLNPNLQLNRKMVPVTAWEQLTLSPSWFTHSNDAVLARLGGGQVTKQKVFS